MQESILSTVLDTTQDLTGKNHTAKELHIILDSLNNRQKRINAELESLQQRASAIKKQQQRADFANGVILLIVFLLILRVILTRLKTKSDQ